MAQVVVRVLASADPSLRNVFDNFKSLSKRAGDAVKRDGDTTTKQRAKGYDADARAFEKAEARKTKAALAETRKQTKAVESEQKRQTAIATREEKARVREQERSTRQAKRDNAQIVRETMSGYNRITTVAGNAFGNMTKIAKTAVGVVTGFAGAIGIDTSVSSITQKGMGFEKAIVDVANSGAGKGGASAQNIAAARSGVESAADATRTDQNAMAGALGKYTSLTGDIGTGIASLTMFGKLARATGTDVEDLAGAAAQIANGLGDVPDKARIVEEALRIVAQQGKLGSVEIKDLATHMGKFASKAQFYEGTREDAMATLGAIAQLSMKGGASTAAEAASAAGNFNRDIAQKKAGKAFDKYGVERYEKSGKTRDASEIIIDSIKATKGDGRKLQEMFTNQSSRKGVLGMAGIYNAAGGGKAGEAAMRAEMKKLRASMSKEDVETNFQNSANTREAKSADMNNRIQRKVGEAVDGLMPAFESMIPALSSLADSMIKMAPAAAKFASFLVENPGVAIVGAITGSILKAGVGDAVKGSLKSLLEGLLPDKKPKPGGGGGGGNAAPAVAAAMAIVGSGVAIWDMAKEENAELQRDKSGLEDIAGVNATEAKKGDNQALFRLSGNIQKMEEIGSYSGWNAPVKDEDKPAWEAEIARLKAERATAMENLSPVDRVKMTAAVLTGDKAAVPENSKQATQATQAMEANSAALQALLGAVTGGLTVTVANMPAGGFDAPGRVPGAPT